MGGVPAEKFRVFFFLYFALCREQTPTTRGSIYMPDRSARAAEHSGNKTKKRVAVQGRVRRGRWKRGRVWQRSNKLTRSASAFDVDGGSLLKNQSICSGGGWGGYQRRGKNEKVRKWGEEVRTRDMAPSYKDPTAQESHCLPLDWQNKSMHLRRVGKEGRGGEKKYITQKWQEWDLV